MTPEVREATCLCLSAYLCKLLVNLKQAGSADLGPADAAGVTVVLNLGNCIHSVTAKGLEVVCVCVRIISMKAGICFSTFSILEEIVIALLIPRPKADSESVLGFTPKRGLLVMWRVGVVSQGRAALMALVYDINLKATGITGH